MLFYGQPLITDIKDKTSYHGLLVSVFCIASKCFITMTFTFESPQVVKSKHAVARVSRFCTAVLSTVLRTPNPWLTKDNSPSLCVAVKSADAVEIESSQSCGCLFHYGPRLFKWKHC